MAFTKYVTQFKDKDDNVYGVMDEECRLSLQNGTHEDLTAGNALFLLSDRGETDNEPYTFRKTGGSKSAYGREMLKKVVGGTIAWNQLINTLPVTQTVNGITFTNNGDGTITANGTATADAIIICISPVSAVIGHVYCIRCCPTGGSNSSYIAYDGYAAEGLDVGNGAIGKMSLTRIYILIRNGYIANNLVFKPQMFDLTAMFGSTIADAIYAMEQATAGSGVAWFKKLFPKNYYAYDAGTLMSVNAESHKTVGFNQWDEEWEVGGYNTLTGAKTTHTDRIRSKNPIKVVPGGQYYIMIQNSAGEYKNYCYYDSDMNFISGANTRSALVTLPNNCEWMTFNAPTAYGTTYNHDICINLSDTSKDGTYEPYQLRSYPLANVELRGIPKWENGQLVFDGDEYTPDGTVTRKYAFVQVDPASLTNNGHSSSTSLYKVFWHRPNGAYTNNVVCNKFVKYATGMDGPYMSVRTNGDGIEFNLTYSMINVSDEDDDSTVKLPAAITWFTNNPVYVVYELATPTTESADPYRELQISNRNGTEEFTDRAEEAGTRDVAIPVGTETFYPVDIFALIDSLQAMILENISNS